MTIKFLILNFLLLSLCTLSGWQPTAAQTRSSAPSSVDGQPQQNLISPKLARNWQNNNSIKVASEPVPVSHTPVTASLPSADSDVDTGFNAGATEGVGSVESTIVQPDGKIVIGGSFSGVNNVPMRSLARINPDGSVDSSFNPGGAGPNANIYALAQQPDGKILIGGNGALYNNVFRGTITRLNADGTPDLGFNSGASANGTIETIGVQPDGKILIGGFFSSFNGLPRNNIARLNQDGSLDATFNPGSGFNSIVYTIVLQPDGRILVGGVFTNYNGTTVGKIVRLNQDATLDQTFNAGAGASSQVETIVLQPDGKILVGGIFAFFNGTPTSGIVRLNSNGTIDTAISPPGIVSGMATAIALQPDGKILVGGAFSDGTTLTRGLARFNSDGSFDFFFNPGQTNGDILSIVVLSGGRILAGGGFTRYNNEEHRRLVLLANNGNVDSAFSVFVNTAGVVYRIAPRADGKILIAGDFEFVNGVPRHRLARLNSDGSLDTTFNPSGDGAADGAIYALTTQPDGKILIGGSFTAFNGVSVNRAARLNENGTLDTTFNSPPQTPAIVYDIKLQENNQILLGGSIFFQQLGASSLVQVNSDGSADPTFGMNRISGTVRSIAVQPDGKILVGGVIGISVSPNQFIIVPAARINLDGTIDSTFDVFPLNGFVEIVKLLSDGRILLGGSLYIASNQFRGVLRLLPNGSIDSSFNAMTVNGTIRALLVQPDGKILVGGFLSNGIARLNDDGSRDSIFNASANDVVDDLTVQRDGKILVGGAFTMFNGEARRGIVRLQGSPALGSRRTVFDFDGDGRADISVFRPSTGAWYRLNSADQSFFAAQFGTTGDKIAPADFDGDGKTDLAVFRPSTGSWYILNSSNNSFTSVVFGAAEDVPAPADFDGDGRADVAVFRPSTGAWFVQRSTQGFYAVQFGNSEDVPQTGDFDGDGKADISVYRPSTGAWYRINSSNNQIVSTQFGAAGDVPDAADFDGDGKTDIAVFRPANGAWYLQESTAGFTALQFGQAGDVPVAADFDGDGKADVAVFRPATGAWYINGTTTGFSAVQFGASEDVPVEAAFNEQ